jgi:hypothetical protein
MGFDAAYTIKEERMIPSVAVEYVMGPMSLNVGYRFNVDEQPLQMGLGLATKVFDFGYAYIPSVNLNATHRVSLGWKV